MTLKYGLQGTLMKFVDDVPNGLDCNCHCISCGEKLIARNSGEYNEHHFAHKGGNNCHELELIITTYLFKEALETLKEFELPKVFIKMEDFDSSYLVKDKSVIKIKNIISVEKNVITLRSEEDEELMILVELKKRKPNVVFDDFNKEDVLKIIVDSTKINTKEDCIYLIKNNQLKIQWLNNKSENFYKEKLKLLVERKRYISRDNISIVEDCPINIRGYHKETFANLSSDCFRCKYFLSSGSHSDLIYCLGKTKIASITDLDNIMQIDNSRELTVINYLDGSKKEVSIDQSPATDLLTLWKENNNKPFLARNLETHVAVFIRKDPFKQHDKYSKCYGHMYKNGYSIGDREIYGYLLNQWLIIPRQKRKEDVISLRKY
jgi:hypothetical protein